ncbi:hypothetical protein MXB_3274, partial [Myxobolus squamalis]
KRLFSACGDGIVDDNEECDCGDKQLCQDFTDKNKCCNSKCHFAKKFYQCTDGVCCSKCMVYIKYDQKYSKSLCRSSIGQCDHPEFCNGRSNK